jgi:hypothetical protein
VRKSTTSQWGDWGIGIRTKFGSRYLSSEYVVLEKPTSFIVPEWIELKENYPPQCYLHRRFTYFNALEKLHRHLDDGSGLDSNDGSLLSTYAPLFEFLLDVEEELDVST